MRTLTSTRRSAVVSVLAFLLVLAGGAFGWSQVTTGPAGEVDIPGWTWFFLIGGFVVAMVCIFKPKASPFLAPLYAVLEGVFLGALSKAFEVQWDGIVFQAVLATTESSSRCVARQCAQ